MTTPASEIARPSVQQIIRERRTVHDFSAEPAPESALLAALDLARWAPNHHRTEPWRFYLLGPAAQAAIAALNADLVRAARGERAAEVKQRRWLAMPGWFVMTSAVTGEALMDEENYAACCCAAQNLMLALWAENIGVKWTTGTVVREPGFASLVGFEPDRERVVGLFWYGYPAGVTEQRRKAVSEFVVRVD